MNESTLTRLKIIVERAVRPVRASTDRKRKMREELLAHVIGVFEEEARLGDERAALARTQERFGQGRATLKRWPGQWLNVVTDGQQHLLAFLTSDARGLHQAVWSGSAYLSWVYHSAVGAEVILAAVQRGLEEGATAADLRQTLSGYQHLFKSDLPGARALLERFGPSPRKGTP